MLIRPAEPSDAMAVARIHVRSWQVAYRTLLPDDHLAQLLPEDRAQKYDFSNTDLQKPHTIVAAEDESIRGFATTSPARDGNLAECGELCALYVDPQYWGRGLGAALIAAARARLIEQGFRQAALWVLAGNARAARFYQIDGWVPDGSQRTVTVWGIAVDELRYRRRLDA